MISGRQNDSLDSLVAYALAPPMSPFVTQLTASTRPESRLFSCLPLTLVLDVILEVLRVTERGLLLFILGVFHHVYRFLHLSGLGDGFLATKEQNPPKITG